MPTHVERPGAMGLTQPRVAPSAPIELPPGAQTTLRHAQFERELAHHPDKAWVSSLLQRMKYGFRLGYTGTRTHSQARNLPSAAKHPEVIDAELAKEAAAGRVLGPFATPPLPRQRCSGLGAVPKKDGRWRMILHFSAPVGSSINDFIDKEEYSLHYASVDDAVHSLLTLGPGAMMAKVDLKSDFRMVPVHPTDWELLGMHWREKLYVDTCLPFGLRSAHSSLTRWPQPWNGSSNTTTPCPTSSTTSMTIFWQIPQQTRPVQDTWKTSSEWQPSWGCKWQWKRLRDPPPSSPF